MVLQTLPNGSSYKNGCKEKVSRISIAQGFDCLSMFPYFLKFDLGMLALSFMARRVLSLVKYKDDSFSS